MKTCRKCKNEYSFDNFGKCSREPDGLKPWCNSCKLEYKNKYYSNPKNVENHKKLNKKWKEENKDKTRQYNLDRKEWWIEYRRNNKERANSRHLERKKTDINYRLAGLLRGRLKRAISGNYKSGSAVSDLGCSIEFLKKYLESKFTEGMSWDNCGRNGWHIDHIVPLSSFDLSDREQFLKACHYTNLQPLWDIDNLKKGDKIA